MKTLFFLILTFTYQMAIASSGNLLSTENIKDLKFASAETQVCADNGTLIEPGFYVDRRGNCSPIRVQRYDRRIVHLESEGVQGQFHCANSTCFHPNFCGTKLLILSPTSFVGIFLNESRCEFHKN